MVVLEELPNECCLNFHTNPSISSELDGTVLLVDLQGVVSVKSITFPLFTVVGYFGMFSLF